MDDKEKSLQENDIDIAEYNNYPRKRTNFTIESNGSKPYDINKMTGNCNSSNKKQH